MYRPHSKYWVALAYLGGASYPFIVFGAREFLSPLLVGSFGFVMVLLQLWHAYGRSHIRWLPLNLGLSCLVMLGLLSWQPAIAARAYPVLMSLAFGTSFGISLIYPPSLIETVARLSEPDLPPAGVAYTYRVTIAWTIFLFLNATISAATALWGSLQLWTLWNGLISYMLMAALFVGEYAIRRVYRHRHA